MRTLDKVITNRVNSDIFKRFAQLAKDMEKNPQQLIRELITATVENRIKMMPKNKRHHDNFYA